MPDLRTAKLDHARHLTRAQRAARTTTEREARRAAEVARAYARRRIDSYERHGFRCVTWRDVVRPGWRDGLQRVLPWVALGSLGAPFTTIATDAWHLAKLERAGGQTEYLAAWDVPGWGFLSSNGSTRLARETVGPWTIRPPRWQALAYLPALTVLNLLLSLYGAWVAYAIWHDSRSNAIPASDEARSSSAGTVLSGSGALAVVYAGSFYWTSSTWSGAVRSTGSTGRAAEGEISIGPGMYCTFASPCVAAIWFGAMWLRCKRAQRSIEIEDREAGRQDGGDLEVG